MKNKKTKNFRIMIIICSVICTAEILNVFLNTTSPAMAGGLHSEISKPSAVSAERWRILADMQKERGDPGVVAINQKVYVLGGFFPSYYGYNQTQEVYDPQNDTWQYRSNLPDPGRSDMAVAAVGEKFYVIGGWNMYLGGALSYNHMYDPVLDTWTTMAPLLTPVSGAGVAVLDNIIYILGGSGNLNGFGLVQKYDPISDSWSLGTSMPEGRSGFGAVSFNGKIYAIGGVLNGGITTNTIEIYDPVADLWIEGPPLPECRASMAVGVRQGIIYVIGGTDNGSIGNPKNTAFLLDPGTGVWSIVDPMPTSRSATRAAVINDIIYVIGGKGDPGAGSANEGFGFQPIESTITVTSDDPDPSQVNQSFTISYNVTAAGEIPTGVVNVTVDGGAKSCSGSLINGLGSCQLTLPAPETYTLTATYSGNYILIGSSDTELHSVVKADTITLIDGGNSSRVGQSFMITFTVTSQFGTPTGLVVVTVSDRSETCSGVLINGAGNCYLNLPLSGIFTLTAEYSGDASFNQSSNNDTHLVDFRMFLPITIR